jgi:hypothetical protein
VNSRAEAKFLTARDEAIAQTAPRDESNQRQGEEKMKATRLQRMTAAVAAVAVTLSIVWSIAGYAYPDSPVAWFDLLARTAHQSRS